MQALKLVGGTGKDLGAALLEMAIIGLLMAMWRLLEPSFYDW